MRDDVPVLLVPGLACSPRIYAAQVPALWRIAPVMLANHRRDATMAGIAKRILDEAPPRFAIAGHSMGGYIALEMFRQAPERIARMALLNTSARPDAPEMSEKRRGWIAECKTNGGYRAVLAGIFPNFVHPNRGGDAALKATVMDMGEDVGEGAFIRQNEASIGRADSRPMLSSIKCRVLVLTSDTDNMVKKEFSTELVEGIPHAKLVVVPDCGHLSQLEKPDEVTAALADWLKAG
jgi:pimeloyl-ACP methyl ester carboxylesterase